MKPFGTGGEKVIPLACRHRVRQINNFGCPCRKSDPDIMVVQSAEDRQGYNSSDRMDGSGDRSVFDKEKMCSSDVVVFLIRAEHMAQMSLAEDEDVIKALPADQADQPFGT